MEQNKIVILYQDHHLLLVNKPAGLVVHPTYKHAEGTLWDYLLLYLNAQGDDAWQPPDLPDEPGWERAPEHIRLMLREKRLAKYRQDEGWLARPVLLHRLDKDTSGILALARTAMACQHLARQFSAHTLSKTYLAVARRASQAWAEPRAPFTIESADENEGFAPIARPLDLAAYVGMTLLLDGPLQRDPDDRRRCIVGPEGQEARTRVYVLTAWDEYVLLDVRPVTGRTHQIRAHLTAAGYPLVGDTTYAPSAEEGRSTAMLSRQFLHASSLTFHAYPTNLSRTVVAPLSADLTAWLQICGSRDAYELALRSHKEG